MYLYADSQDAEPILTEEEIIEIITNDAPIFIPDVYILPEYQRDDTADGLEVLMKHLPNRIITGAD